MNSVWPARRCRYSSEVGSLTFSTRSAPPQTSAASCTIRAPAATYSSLLIAEPTPAFVSTSTSCPRQWSSLTPAGVSVALGGIGADALGRSGQTGQVDTHFWERFGSAALISVFGMAPQLAVDGQTDADVADALDAIGGDLES